MNARAVSLRAALVAASIALAPCALADDAPLEVTSTSPSFAPADGDEAAIALSLSRPGALLVEVLEPDGNVARTLVNGKPADAGETVLSWDGRDDAGEIVPDESYTVRATLLDDDGAAVHVAAPSEGTGGEMLDPISAVVSSDSIGFVLDDPARVLVRIGTRGGPMHRNLLRWAPRVAGSNRVGWDGLDDSGVVDLRDRPGTAVMVAAYRLPEASIVAYGNDAIGYREWFGRRGFAPATTPPDERSPQRGDARIAREHYRSRYADVEPDIDVRLLAGGRELEPPYALDDDVIVRVETDPDSEWLLTETLFEVGFFVDDVFVAEEEQGFLPLSWRLDPARFGPGEHVLTVNLSGFDGRVGTASLRFVAGGESPGEAPETSPEETTR